MRSHPLRSLAIPSVWNPTGSGPTGQAWKASAHTHTHTASSCPTIMTSSWSGLASIQLQQRHSSILSTVVFMYLGLSGWPTEPCTDFLPIGVYLASCRNTPAARLAAKHGWMDVLPDFMFLHPAAPVEYVRCPFMCVLPCVHGLSATDSRVWMYMDAAHAASYVCTEYLTLSTLVFPTQAARHVT